MTDLDLHRDSVDPTLQAPPTVDEIQERLRRRYLDRLSQKVKQLRKMLLDRNWEGLRNETRHLRESGSGFGFESLSYLAGRAESAIPEGNISRLRTIPKARQAVETLIGAIDRTLIENMPHFF